jgi:Ser/Thr protein kinase RdoA (MazF antagonist)
MSVFENSAKMWPVGWEALEQWGDDVARIEPLAGGVANDVWSMRVKRHLAVGRLGARSDADLAWETELLQHLDREGLTVPVPIPTTDGRLFADGLVVMTYVEGGPPETEADWRRVADTLRQLHRLTQGWPQRPGWRSSPTSCTPRPGRRSTSARCRLRASLDAEQRGRGSPGVSHASSTATQTLATSA